MRAVKSVSIDSERRVIITYLDGSTETLFPEDIDYDEAISLLNEEVDELKENISLIDEDISSLNEDITNLQTGKQDVLTFDQTPTAESTNPVTSVGIKNAIEVAVDVTAPGIYETASGSIASFTDGADNLPLKSCVVNIEPIQEGTGDPSPENARPIVGRTGVNVVRCGKNLFLPMASGGQSANVSFVRNNDGSVTFTGQVNGTTRTPTIGDVRLPAGNYILSGVSDGSESTYGLRLSDYTTGSQVVITTIYSGEAEFTLTKESLIRVIGRFSVDKTDAYNVTMYPMIRRASVMDETYEPYNSTVYSVNWETEAGTVYGGTLDVISGKLTVDKGIYIVTGNENISYNSNYEYFNILTALPDCAASVRGGLAGICSHYPVSSSITANTIYKDYAALVTYGNLIVTATVGRWQVRDNRFTTVEDFRAYLSGQSSSENPVQLVYLLATPIETQLTPQEVRTLLGENNIWSDGGDVTAKYPADTKMYIDQKITEAIAAEMA